MRSGQESGLHSQNLHLKPMRISLTWWRTSSWKESQPLDISHRTPVCQQMTRADSPKKIAANPAPSIEKLVEECMKCMQKNWWKIISSWWTAEMWCHEEPEMRCKQWSMRTYWFTHCLLLHTLLCVWRKHFNTLLFPLTNNHSVHCAPSLPFPSLNTFKCERCRAERADVWHGHPSMHKMYWSYQTWALCSPQSSNLISQHILPFWGVWYITNLLYY